MKEKILCAAINYNGIIVCGFRHSDCYEIIKSLVGDINSDNMPKKDNQGFLTSKNRYVGRKEAWIIAKENKQIIYGLETFNHNNGEKPILISENLY